MNKKRESNAFANILAMPVTPTPVVSPQSETQQVKVGRGRPKARAETPQATTVRLSQDNHMKVRQLALRDRIAMNTLIHTALSEYCQRRGVKLENELLKS